MSYQFDGKNIVPKENDLSVWWIPQVPGDAFRVPVDTIAEGRKLEIVLAQYDLFQYENSIKPDYSNVGGIARYEKDGDGYDWFDVDEEEEDE